MELCGELADLLSMKKLSEQQLLHDIDLLQHGGAEAISLFFTMASKFFNTGGKEYLEHWVTAAASALPESDRNAVLVALLGALFDGEEVHVDVKEASGRTLQ
jgi:hypothetical protein